MAGTFEHISSELQSIEGKVKSGKRISIEEGIVLYELAPLGWLGILANYRKEQLNGKNVYFNRNIHVEPTNICLYQCEFCSFKRETGDVLSWNYSHDEILGIVRSHLADNITEVHITGGVFPNRSIDWYVDLIKKIKKIAPRIHIKGFTAIELNYMVQQSGHTIEEGLEKLKKAGLGSIPGGGAEIFDKEIRTKLCPQKGSSTLWLNIHEKAHNAGLFSNATMLYGHIETYAHRILHMNEIRILQDKTHGFNAFIPLKFRKQNNFLSHLSEIPLAEDLRNYAVSRIFLDNITHLKAYWPMIGKESARFALHFGADDLDGTIYDTTKIYSLAGSEEKSPGMTLDEISSLICSEGFVPVERNSLYEPIICQ
jgi:aminodeoxyfutalosine synthase